VLHVSDEPDSLVLVYLRRIDKNVADLREDVREVRTRLGFLEEQYASLSRRVDRIGGELEQVRRRLDIADAPAS
jgi:predicted nuclease with TOPRIM domain